MGERLSHSQPTCVAEVALAGWFKPAATSALVAPSVASTKAVMRTARLRLIFMMAPSKIANVSTAARACLRWIKPVHGSRR